MKPILGYYAFLLLFLVLLIVLTWISIARLKMTQESMSDGSGSYVLSHVQAKSSPKESWEKVDTVGSAGQYSTALYDLKIHSREKIDCIAPGVYNRDTFECDCPEGYDYSAVYGCISKCQPFQKYVPYTDGRGGGYCVNICNPDSLDASQNTYYDAVQDACLKCSFDTYNDGNNNCIPRAACPSGTRYVDDSGECKKCLTGQVFNDHNECVVACPSYQLMRNGVCEPRCPLQYQYWSDGGSGGVPSCMNCPTGYVANALNQCVPSSVTCRPGEHYDATHTCVSVCLDHEKWNAELGNCIPKCSDTQRYDAKLNGCVYCPIGQHANGANGCAAPPVTPVPTPSCPAGFKLDSTFTACDTVCPYWRYNAEDDPTVCELLCPINTQYYEKDVNNGCVNCPVGYIADPNNQCTMCDTDNGYIMDAMGRCTFECQSYQTWNAVTDVCDYNCPDNNTYYVEGKGCQYCPEGYLVNQTNQCSLCDTDKGYVASGDKCVQQCLPWQRWDNKHKKCVYHCQSESQVYDLENEVCVTCQQLHDNHYILGTNRNTNQCQVGGIFTKAPVVVPPVYVPPANVNVPSAPTVTPTPAAAPSLSVTLTELRDTGATLSITSNYDGNIVFANNVVGSFKAGAAAQSVAASFTLTESPVDLHVTLLNANGQPMTGSGTSKVVSILPKTSTNTFTVSPSSYLYQVNYTLVGGGGGGGSGASTGDSGSTGCTGGGGGAGQSITGTYTLPGYTNSVGVQLTTGLGGAGGAPVTGSGGANGGAGQATALKLSNGTAIGQAAGGGGGSGGGAGSGNNCSGGAGGASGDPANSIGKGINGNDWSNSDYGRARGGTNSSGSGSGGHGGLGGQSGASGIGEAGGNGAGTFTAKYYAVSVQ
jgi:hypothetical protein